MLSAFRASDLILITLTFLVAGAALFVLAAFQRLGALLEEVPWKDQRGDEDAPNQREGRGQGRMDMESIYALEAESSAGGQAVPAFAQASVHDGPAPRWSASRATSASWDSPERFPLGHAPGSEDDRA